MNMDTQKHNSKDEDKHKCIINIDSNMNIKMNRKMNMYTNTCTENII